MNSEFDKRLKNIEQELTDLKTASEYSSIRSAAVTYSQLVYTGTYRIEYDNKGEDVFSIITTGIIQDNNTLGKALGRTPVAGVQIVEVFTSYENSQGQEVTKSTTMVVVSNVPVLNISRMS